MPTIRLQSSEGNIFDTDVETAKCLGTVKAMLGDGDLDEGDDTVIPLPNVTAAILRKVLEWAHYHKNDPEPPVVDRCIPPWYADFLSVDQDTLFDLIAAANYLDTKELLDMALITVANMIKGKSKEEMRKIFSTTNAADE